MDVSWGLGGDGAVIKLQPGRTITHEEWMNDCTTAASLKILVWRFKFPHIFSRASSHVSSASPALSYANNTTTENHTWCPLSADEKQVLRKWLRLQHGEGTAQELDAALAETVRQFGSADPLDTSPPSSSLLEITALVQINLQGCAGYLEAAVEAKSPLLVSLLKREFPATMSMLRNHPPSHISIVFCGHVDAGSSTLCGHLLWQLGEVSKAELDRCRNQADHLQKLSFVFAFVMYRSMDERRRGVTLDAHIRSVQMPNGTIPVAPTTAATEQAPKCFEYSFIDVPKHRDYTSTMIRAASMADVAILMVPADGNFWTAIQRGNHQMGEVQGQTRHHSRILNLLGIKQLIVCVNKMDCDIAGYKQIRFEEIVSETKGMLVRTGWKRDAVEKRVCFLPISAWAGDNLMQQSGNMPWWRGTDVDVGNDGGTVHVTTLFDCLSLLIPAVLMLFDDGVPQQASSGSNTRMEHQDLPLRLPVQKIYGCNGTWNDESCIVTGRVEQGVLKVGDIVGILASGYLGPFQHSAKAPLTKQLADELGSISALVRCHGRVTSIQMQSMAIDHALAGDIVGVKLCTMTRDGALHNALRGFAGDQIKNKSTTMFSPHVGDILVLEKDLSLPFVRSFVAQVQTLDIPGVRGMLRVGRSFVAHVRTGRSPCRLACIHWKMGKNSQGQRVETPDFLSSNEMAECCFELLQPLVVDHSKSPTSIDRFCRILFLDENTVEMVGKIISTI